MTGQPTSPPLNPVAAADSADGRADSAAASGWPALAVRLGVALALIAFAAFVTRDALIDLWRAAMEDEEASHLRLVPLAVAWLAWVRRDRVAAAPGGAYWLGAAIAAMAALTYLVGERLVIESMWHAGALLLPVGIVAGAVGGRKLLAAWPAALCVLFAVPVPGTIRAQIALPLQEWSAVLAAHALELLGEPVVRKGSVLTVAGFDVAVAEACNGMRMFFALALVGFLYAFLHPLRPWARLLVLAASPVVALACNVLRLVPTAWMYGHASEAAADGFHDAGGWLMLFVAYGLLAGLVAVLRWAGVPVDRDEPVGNVDRVEPIGPNRPRWRAWGVAAAVTLAVTAVAYADRWVVRAPAPETESHHLAVQSSVAASEQVIDAGAGGLWVGESIPVPPSALNMLQPNAVLSRFFKRAGGGASGTEVGAAHLLLIHVRDARDLLGHYPPVCYPGMGWQTRGVDAVALPGVAEAAGLGGLTATRYDFARTLSGTTDRIRVYNLMLLPDGTAGRDMAAIEDATRRLRLRERGAGQVQVVFRAPSGGTPEQRRAVLESEERVVGRLLAAHAPALRAMLGRSDDAAADGTGFAVAGPATVR